MLFYYYLAKLMVCLTRHQKRILNAIFTAFSIGTEKYLLDLEEMYY